MRRNLDILLRPNPNGDWPQVEPTAYIDPTAQVIGNVHIGPDVFIMVDVRRYFKHRTELKRKTIL